MHLLLVAMHLLLGTRARYYGSFTVLFVVRRNLAPRVPIFWFRQSPTQDDHIYQPGLIGLVKFPLKSRNQIDSASAILRPY